ncbi:MAG: phosphoribosylanthranilate isomerase [Acidobacteriota bacterium]|jgi:phosphoribosylanthranilate isomerase|nr:phosphoribosylanthranilate isomerase [Acidobacteriota bacterium]
MTKIKICGLTRAEDAVLSASLGADFLGFIFVPTTPRFVEPEEAAEIIRAVRQREKPPKIVGVFRDASNEYIREVAAVAGLDLVQLHGTESEEDISTLDLPTVKSFRVGDTLPDTTSVPSAEWLLFDTYDERRSGGTGRRFDWSLLAMYPRSKPFFLAGGLTPENVGAAVSLARPDAIDLASGVEAEPGIKDHQKLRSLFERVRRA